MYHLVSSWFCFRYKQHKAQIRKNVSIAIVAAITSSSKIHRKRSINFFQNKFFIFVSDSIYSSSFPPQNPIPFSLSPLNDETVSTNEKERNLIFVIFDQQEVFLFAFSSIYFISSIYCHTMYTSIALLIDAHKTIEITTEKNNYRATGYVLRWLDVGESRVVSWCLDDEKLFSFISFCYHFNL